MNATALNNNASGGPGANPEGKKAGIRGLLNDDEMYLTQTHGATTNTIKIPQNENT